MFHEITINGMILPRPDGDLEFVSEKLKTEYELVIPETDEPMLLAIWRDGHVDSGSERHVIDRFRIWAGMDTVTVSAFFPQTDEMTEHECQFAITGEKHVHRAREQLRTDGLYQMTVKMEEL